MENNSLDARLSPENQNQFWSGDEVWNYINENSERTPAYNRSRYMLWLREHIRRDYLPDMLDERFSGRPHAYGSYEASREPQEFQHQAFWYLIETTPSKFGVLRKIRCEDVELDSDMESDLQGIFYGVKAAVHLLDRAQTLSGSRATNRFPQVEPSTINAAGNDNAFEVYSFALDQILTENPKNQRDRIAQAIGRACSDLHSRNSLARGLCDRTNFIVSSMVTTQLIIEQLAIRHFEINRPKNYK